MTPDKKELEIDREVDEIIDDGPVTFGKESRRWYLSCAGSKTGNHCWHLPPSSSVSNPRAVCCWCGIQDDRHGDFAI